MRTVDHESPGNLKLIHRTRSGSLAPDCARARVSRVCVCGTYLHAQLLFSAIYLSAAPPSLVEMLAIGNRRARCGSSRRDFRHTVLVTVPAPSVLAPSRPPSRRPTSYRLSTSANSASCSATLGIAEAVEEADFDQLACHLRTRSVATYPRSSWMPQATPTRYLRRSP